MASPIHVLQASFASGLISPEVANRSDLDKYRAALTVAKNCYIRPYGPAYKRGGMVYCNATKYNDKTSIIVPFAVNTTVNFLLEVGHGYIRIHKNGAYTNIELATPYTESMLQDLRFTQSADVMFICSGSYPVKVLTRRSDTNWTFGDYGFSQIYFDPSISTSVETSDEIMITPSGTSGNISLSASANCFTSSMVGGYLQLTQNVPGASSKVNNATTAELVVGETWKIMTGGTWTGTVTVQQLLNGQWVELRSYQSTDNYNVTETGTFTEETKIRAICSISSGTCTMTLQRYPYDKSGFCRITGVSSATSASATVIKAFGTTSGTKDYAWGVWNNEFGYPSCACFFQDRLCLGATRKQPYGIWMSKVGDYASFEVEKAGGNVTDDSAVAASFISRRQQKIMHMVASADLIVFTEGNEWIISGSEVVTPSNITPRMQTTRGCNHCEPLTIGNRLVFVQGRGSNVRDMGYTYESDSYAGQDLTILAQDLVRGVDIVDTTYKQEPNSMIYCVRSDGTVVCLSYIREQEVYAWAEVETDGNVEAVCCVGEGDEDKVYAVVLRKGKRYIEYFSNDVYSDRAQDYVMLDCAKTFSVNTPASSFTVSHLANRKIDVLADGRVHKNISVDANGTFTLPAEVKEVVAGLPYTMQMELPNIEVQLQDGSMQGRKKTVSSCTLRLRKSLGGSVGSSFDVMDDIKYDEVSATENIQVFSGDKQLSVPMGGYNYYGRIAIQSSDPYPFMLMAAVRVVTFGG